MSSKEKILEVACDLFFHQGYVSTSVDDIIARAGVSKSNFYYHYKSKEDLGIAVLEQRKEDLQALLASTLRNTSLPPRSRLEQYLQFQILAQDELLSKSGCPFGNLVAEMAEHSERFRCQLSTMFWGLTQLLTDLIEEGQRRGEFRRDAAPTDIACLILQTTQGMHLMAKCHKTVDAFGRSILLLLRLLETDGNA